MEASVRRPPSLRARTVAAALVALSIGAPGEARAQTVDVSPFYGYRFGGGFFEELTQQPVDLDGAPAVGAAINIRFRDDLQIEALVTHQDATVVVPGRYFSPDTRWHLTVQHFMGGGLREFDYGRARPFLTGLLGLTRYAAPGDNEVRFTVSAGGGVRLFPAQRIGIRLEGRSFWTFADVEGRAIACTPGLCLTAVDAKIIWQTEFTAGLTARF